MKFLEKDLEDIIWESDNEKLNKKGLPINGKKIRQLRIGNYGIADLVTIERIYDFNTKESYLDITVYELKKDKAGISAFLQAIRYCKGIKTYFEEKRENINIKLNIVLCAKEIDCQSDYIFIKDMVYGYDYGSINNIDNYSFDYTIDGIIFKNESGYNLTNKGF